MAPALFTKASACLKSGNVKARVMWWPLTTFHCGTCFERASSSLPASGGTPPLHGTQVLLARSLMSYLRNQIVLETGGASPSVLWVGLVGTGGGSRSDQHLSASTLH